uniref:Cationic amino acid transporter C-terminal domain-containing protein n=1 Tax=Kalanchoe fedtschenkoi TaxID=63787 RepID=A0A7N0UIB7_KALFE
MEPEKTFAPDRRSDSASRSSFCSHFWSSALRSKPLNTSSNSGDELVRRLGMFDLILIGVGASIGAGIFVVTGTVARDAGPGVTVSFILAGVSCVLNALCYAELASRFPAVVGGAYLYSYTAFNEITAFLVFMQLMLDYHIGAASIARSLANYLVNLLELIPIFKHHIPDWIGHGGQKFLGETFSINILAPILLIILTIILCRGVGESSIVNSFMTSLKIVIVIIVIIAGSFKVDVANWSPFFPNGVKPVLTGATVVFFAYVGFDAVANSAEESKKPQRNLPIGIMGSLLVCASLYIAVCLVITGMVPYKLLGEDAPLAEAFKAKGMKYISILISIGAVAGLTTTLLVGLYVQSRLYLGLGRDGLLPGVFGKVHSTRHTPLHSQIWVGFVTSILAGLLNVRVLSHILSVGTLTGYSVVAACVVAIRWKNKSRADASARGTAAWMEGTCCLVTIALCGFGAGVCYRYNGSFIILVVAGILAVSALSALYWRQVYGETPGFSCPWVPFVPGICILFNMFLFAQLHVEAWVRFLVLSVVSVGIYAAYGQYHAKPVSSNHTTQYHRSPGEAV